MQAVTNELRESTHVLVTAAPSPERGDPMLNGFADILAECQPSIQWYKPRAVSIYPSLDSRVFVYTIFNKRQILESFRVNIYRGCRVGYLSTTGVYGDRGGDVVDETSPVGAKSRRGQLRVDAENAWIATGESCTYAELTQNPLRLFVWQDMLPCDDDADLRTRGERIILSAV
jgi:hypothetical protein